MDKSERKPTPPHGWGAPEILRAMRGDSRRYRSLGNPVADGYGEEWDDAADTIRDPRRQGR